MCPLQFPNVWLGLPTNSWIAGVVNALQAPAVGVPAAPLVPSLLQPGAASTCRTEAVAAVPGQHRASLSYNSWKTKRGNGWSQKFVKSVMGALVRTRVSYCVFLTSLFLTEFQQVPVGGLWEGAVLFSAAFKEFSGIFVCVKGEPHWRLLDSLLCLRGWGGRGGGLFLLYS